MSFFELEDEEQYLNFLQELDSADVDDLRHHRFGAWMNETLPDSEEHFSSEDDESRWTARRLTSWSR